MKDRILVSSRDDGAARHQRVVFGASPKGDTTDVILGVSAAAWEYMKDGKTHTFDLQSIGLPLRIVLFGAKDTGEAYAVIEKHNASLGLKTEDRSSEDFSMKSAPVNRDDVTLTDGSPVTPDHREIKPDGMQKGYVVLSDAERNRGFVRPVRHAYTHLVCGTTTTMGRALAETYARDPEFYGATFCFGCGAHYPVGKNGEFVWEGTDEKVGS